MRAIPCPLLTLEANPFLKTLFVRGGREVAALRAAWPSDRE